VNEHESECRDRFEALFASYGADIVAYCTWRGRLPSRPRTRGRYVAELTAPAAALRWVAAPATSRPSW